MKPLLTIAVAASLLSGCASRPQHARNWEYKVVSGQVLFGKEMLDAAINREVEQGWEFVSASQAADQWGFAVLRRERK